MKKSVACALVALSTLSATTAISAAASNLRILSGPMIAKPGKLIIGYRFGCSTVGPVEFPNAVQLWNTASFATPAGLKVKWSIAPTGQRGIATLPALAPGKGVKLPVSPVFAGMSCKTQVL